MSIAERPPGFLKQLALQAHAAEERRKAVMQEAAWRLDNDAQRAGLQSAIKRLFGIVVDVDDLPTDPTGRPHIIVDGHEFAPLAPTAAGWGLCLILRCAECRRVGASIPVSSLAQFGLLLEEGVTVAQACAACDAGWRATA